ncbi:hypothetical protein [Rhizorhabdus sp. FW153]|uniref:hypothetical protein n=1 Tax=Rhizorhabdus sp. FW153 TaxID=3400216 RepID=UPI003CEDCEEA
MTLGSGGWRLAPDGAIALYGSATSMAVRRPRHRAPAMPGLGLSVTIGWRLRTGFARP